MRAITLILFLSLAILRLPAQGIDRIFNPDAVKDVETALASDAMRGRATFTPDIERAADYIESQFRQAGLQTWNGSSSYRQPFSMIQSKLVSLTGTVDGNAISAD